MACNFSYTFSTSTLSVWKLWVPYEFPRVKKHQLMKFGIFFAAQVSTKTNVTRLHQWRCELRETLQQWRWAKSTAVPSHRCLRCLDESIFGANNVFFGPGRIGSGTYKIVIWKKIFAVNLLCQDFKVVSIDALTKWQPSNKHSLPSHAQKFARTYTFSSIN